MKNAMSLTVATYNICHGRFADFHWERIASPIRSVNPDLVGIQEVDMFTHRSRGMDSLRALSEATGLPHALFVPTMDFDGGQYGTAVLSRHPIEMNVIFPLPTAGLEPRAVGCVRVRPDGEQGLWFVNTHLSYKSAEVRYEQLSVLKRHMDEIIPHEMPTVLLGDFNTEECLFPVVGDRFRDINGDLRYVTFPHPPMAIDRIVYTPSNLSVIDSGMVESDASDHHLLWAKFQYM